MLSLVPLSRLLLTTRTARRPRTRRTNKISPINSLQIKQRLRSRLRLQQSRRVQAPPQKVTIIVTLFLNNQILMVPRLVQKLGHDRTMKGQERMIVLWNMIQAWLLKGPLKIKFKRHARTIRGSRKSQRIRPQ